MLRRKDTSLTKYIVSEVGRKAHAICFKPCLCTVGRQSTPLPSRFVLKCWFRLACFRPPSRCVAGMAKGMWTLSICKLGYIPNIHPQRTIAAFRSRLVGQWKAVLVVTVDAQEWLEFNVFFLFASHSFFGRFVKRYPVCQAPCSVTDGSSVSATYPCSCGSATCSNYDACVNATSTCVQAPLAGQPGRAGG